MSFSNTYIAKVTNSMAFILGSIAIIFEIPLFKYSTFIGFKFHLNP